MFFKILALVLLIFFQLIFPKRSLASSNLEISNNRSFSELKTNFNVNENIFVRIKTNNISPQIKIVNIRDNTYKLLKTYNLEKSEGYFLANFNAPNNDGIFSLEVQIEGEGSKQTSVKTIKVGSSQSQNVNINVSQNTSGINNEQVESKSEVNDKKESNLNTLESIEKNKESVLEKFINLIKNIFPFSFWNKSN